MIQGQASWIRSCVLVQQKTINFMPLNDGSIYRAAATAAQENTWLTQLLKDLRQSIDQVTLHCDNRSAICLADNPVFHARTKHIEVHYHFIREKVLQDEIHMELTPTEEQVANIFTKGLNTKKFEDMHAQIGMISRLAT